MLVYLLNTRQTMTQSIETTILYTAILSGLALTLSFIAGMIFYINKDYHPNRKWFIDTDKNGYIEIIPKYQHLEDQMDALTKAPKFLNWLNNFDPEQITLRSVTITDIDWFAANYNPLKLGFVKCQSEAYDFKTGKKIVSSISFIRGNSVAILILVNIIGQNKQYVLLCEQQRLPIGKRAKEIVAGMMDADGNIISVVLQEVKQETGFDIKHVSELRELGSYYASPGGSDEEIHLFAWTKTITAAEFKEKQNKMFGLAEENEEIKLSFVNLDKFRETNMYEIRDAKAEIALSRFLKMINA